jgi:hypothetical protein
MGKRRRNLAAEDAKWSDVIKTDRPGKHDPQVQCIYCKHVWYAAALSRLELHMESCQLLPNALWERYNRGACAPKRQRVQGTLNTEAYSMPVEEKHTLDSMLAEAFYASGIPFSFVSNCIEFLRVGLTIAQVENDKFCKFLNCLRPSYKPPSRKALAGDLLNDAYARTKLQMDRIIAESAGQITLASDGWSNQRSESLTNYVATTRTDSIFVGSEVLGAERHTGEVVARGLGRIIEQLGGSEAVVAVTTDNAANMKKAWPELEKRYPGLLTLGCASHTVNLLVEDILKLSDLTTTLDDALHVIRYFKGSNVRTGALTAVAKAAQQTRISLKLPGKTRWQGKVEAITSLIANKPYILELVDNQLACLGNRPTPADAANLLLIRLKVHEYRFWEQLDSLLRFLKPFLEVTIALEATKPRGSRLYAYFKHLLAAAIPTSLPRLEILTLISKRWLQVANPVFTVAYICDPAARDERPVLIPVGTKVKMANWLGQRYTEPGVASRVYQELLAVWEREGIYSNDVIWGSFTHCPDPADWWKQQEHASPELRALAIYALSINPTTGAAERNWSLHSYLHSKARNRLTNERVQKLVYLFQNYRVRDRVLTSCPSYFNDDEVEECSDSDSDENPATEGAIVLAERPLVDDPIDPHLPD